MFDFLFRRPGKRAARPASAIAQPATDKPDAGEAKRAALAEANALAHDEAAAADFIARCPVADARLLAAGHVHSPDLLERTLKAVRNTDRRVAKLMQARLDALRSGQRDAQRAAGCLRQAGQLAQAPLLIANQVAALDREWRAIDVIPDDTRAAFDAMREQLRDRLEAQAGLQRAVRDLVAQARQLGSMASSAIAGEDVLALDRLHARMAELLASPHAAALPPQLAADFRQHEADARAKLSAQLSALAERDAAMRARETALSEWEQAAAATLDRAALTSAWRALPALGDEHAVPFEARFAKLLAAIDTRHRIQPASPTPEKTSGPTDRGPTDIRQFMDTLARLEQALQDGSLQAAAEADRTLHGFDLQGMRLDSAQSARLAAARAELNRLQAWARWGGNISREELLKAAQALPAEELPVPELARRVGSLRARWKSLDVSAGPAHRDAWERFDAACSTAYAPAAAYFAQRGQERAANLQSGRQLIEDVRGVAGSLVSAGAPAPADWKTVAQFCARAQQAWRQLGPIDRKEKKQLDRDFEAAMQALLEPLAAERRAEIGRRERLIDEVASIDMRQRGAADAVRALQERWQQQSKSLPLERRDEQALWQRFRAACDDAFAVRKQAAAAADHERDANLQLKTALCLRLEQAEPPGEREAKQLLREAREQWDDIGAVPRTAGAAIEQRFASAMAQVQGRLDSARELAAAAVRATVRSKLQCCLDAEAALAGGAPGGKEAAGRWRADWCALAPLPAALDKPLRQRFEAALDALERDDREQAARLEANRAVLLDLLLKAEIMLAIDSPAGLSRERLEQQVLLLQGSLKAGAGQSPPGLLLRQMLGTPAAADAATVARLMQVLDRMPASME